jgi:ribosomal protein S18 acetylase RimI-like enzyme
MFELKPVQEDELSAYFDNLWKDLRVEFIEAGFSTEYADENIESSKKQYFPNNKLAPGNFLFYAFDDGVKVGKLWLYSVERESKTEWSVYDIETFDGFRGKGFGRSIMLEAENYVRSKNGVSISLSVFGNNLVAKKLYDSLNYETIKVGMKKNLD